MSYIPSENGAKVNLIKKKFEENMVELNCKTDQEQKDTLRRSLSASPVKVKKNMKLNVTRQLSNPGKNIKRTPAFRGDKLTRIKNLHSPSRDKPSSIVHKNVKIFEETPEYGKIGNVKKKDKFEDSNFKENQTKERSKKITENTVRTTVISRQKNIYPLNEQKDKDIAPINLFDSPKIENISNFEASRMEKFLMNGVEYTQVLKSPKTPSKTAKTSETLEKSDIREDLSRRKSPEISNIQLTESLKAALQAPLPPGPPPKKPPRTFAHSPLTQRSWKESPKLPEETLQQPFRKPQRTFLHNPDVDVTDSPSKNSDGTSQSDDDHKDYNSTKIASNNTSRSRSTRDSKKMLEKLETVLIQHQKALGPKVIMPRREKSEISIGFDSKQLQNEQNELIREKTDKKALTNRLSRTMETDGKKLASLGKLEQRTRKHSTFDCLPYLNCASGIAYEQPTFRNYCSEDSNDKSKSEDSLSSSISNILNSSDFYDDSLSPGSKRLSTELTTFGEGRRRPSGSVKSEERVYAEPFSFDKNSGTDITGFGELSPEEHNYLSRSWCNEGFAEGKRRDEGGGDSLGRKQSTELHYLVNLFLCFERKGIAQDWGYFWDV